MNLKPPSAHLMTNVEDVVKGKVARPNAEYVDPKNEKNMYFKRL
jgi:hypothetical protein